MLWLRAAAPYFLICHSIPHLVPLARRSLSKNARYLNGLRSPISDCGEESYREIRAHWPNWLPGESLDSRPSWRIPGYWNFRAATIARCTKVCVKPQGSDCLSQCTPKTMNSFLQLHLQIFPLDVQGFVIFWTRD